MRGGPPPARGLLTTFLVARLSAALGDADPPGLVGDGIAPEASGWTGGQPGAGAFVPYAVVFAVPAQTTGGRVPLTDPDAAWTLDHRVTYWGAIREQADYYADLGSPALQSGKISPPDSPVPGFGIQLIEVTTLGTAERTDQVAPQLWSRTDLVRTRVARARGV